MSTQHSRRLFGKNQTREKFLAELESDPAVWDAIIIGGGITGAGILRECRRHGLRALLIEQHDFAWGTSSKSSKMVHGGLRYLATGQLRLTRDSVRERKQLMEQAPGLVEPLPFLMTHYKGQFPPPALFDQVLNVYDAMGGKRNHQFHSVQQVRMLAPGLSEKGLKGATQFQDAVTDDARLTLRVLQEAVEDECVALNYCQVMEVTREQGRASGVVLQDRESKRMYSAAGRVVINAAGAWTGNLRQESAGNAQIRPLRGSHLLLPGWRFPVAFAVSYFHPLDKRPVFIFPWEGATVIGTTDLDHSLQGDSDVAINEVEVDYLLSGVNALFPHLELTANDIVSTWAGVRPVVSSGALSPSSEKREHSVWDDSGLVSVAGGKLTTFRLIALDTLRQAAPYLGKDAEIFRDRREPIFESVGDSAPDAWREELSSQIGKRLVGRYGRRANRLLLSEDGHSRVHVSGTNTLWGEFEYALREEGVMHLDDLMLRRTRVGLLLAHGGAAVLDEIKPFCQRILGWDEQAWESERKRYLDIIHRYFSLPEALESTADPEALKNSNERKDASHLTDDEGVANSSQDGDTKTLLHALATSERA